MLVLFIRINSERIWENWGMDNDLHSIMQSNALLMTSLSTALNPTVSKPLNFHPLKVIELFLSIS